MFTKKKKIGGGQYGVYKDVVDWDAVWGWVVMGGIALFLLAMCSG